MTYVWLHMSTWSSHVSTGITIYMIWFIVSFSVLGLLSCSVGLFLSELLSCVLSSKYCVSVVLLSAANFATDFTLQLYIFKISAIKISRFTIWIIEVIFNSLLLSFADGNPTKNLLSRNHANNLNKTQTHLVDHYQTSQRKSYINWMNTVTQKMNIHICLKGQNQSGKLWRLRDWMISRRSLLQVFHLNYLLLKRRHQRRAGRRRRKSWKNFLMWIVMGKYEGWGCSPFLAQGEIIRMGILFPCSGGNLKVQAQDRTPSLLMLIKQRWQGF